MVVLRNTITFLILLIFPLISTFNILPTAPTQKFQSVNLKRINRNIDFYHPITNQWLTSTNSLKNINSKFNSFREFLEQLNNETDSIHSINERKHIYHLKSTVLGTNSNYYFQNNGDSNSNYFYTGYSYSNETSADGENSENSANNENNDGVSILYGGILKSFEYFLPVLIGSPGKLFTLQVDTGSTTSAVPGYECQLYSSTTQRTTCSCSIGSVDGSYRVGDSSTSQVINCNDKSKTKCRFSLSYGDQSFINGSLIYDNITVAGYTVRAKFGSIEKESLSFSQLKCPHTGKPTNIRDGIFGLSYQSLDPNGGDDIFSLIVKEHSLENSFSMCLGDEGGILVFGGMDEQYNAGIPVYTKILEEKFYGIKLTSITVGQTTITIPNSVYKNISIVDSGTTLLILDEPIFEQFIVLLQNLPNSYQLPGFNDYYFWNGNCHLLSPKDLELYPTIYLEFPGINGVDSFQLAIPPSLYLLNIDSMGLYCFGISKLNINASHAIIGDVVLQGFNVHFNRAHGTIGFAPVSNCNSIYNSENFTLSIVDGNTQSSIEGSVFGKPLTLSLLSDDSPTNGVIVGFTIVSGNAVFHPSLLTITRNITDINGQVNIFVKPTGHGKIQIQATVWENNKSNSVDFNLYGKLKTWKIILISLGVLFIVGLLIFGGFIIYKKKTMLKNMIKTNTKQYQLIINDILNNPNNVNNINGENYEELKNISKIENINNEDQISIDASLLINDKSGDELKSYNHEIDNGFFSDDSDNILSRNNSTNQFISHE